MNSIKLNKKILQNVPSDFDWKVYVALNPDLVANGINTEKYSILHYAMHGFYENRIYKKVKLSKNKNIRSVPETWNISNSNIMFFTPNAPDYDVSGGGLRLLRLLEILRYEMKLNIHYFCNAYQNIKHIHRLEQMDISTYLPNIDKGIYLDKSIEKLYSQGEIFDIAFFGWYDMGYQYMDIVKKYYPNIKTVIDTVDVHWIREQRGKDSGNLDIEQEFLQERKNIEKHVYTKADVVISVSRQDQKHIESEIGCHNNIKNIGYIQEPTDLLELGTDIVFIGNYAHGPNIDAANNCIDIFESFQKTKTYQKLKSKPKLVLVGPNLKKEVIQKIQKNKSIEYAGFCEQLSDAFTNKAIVLAPLTWGAGIKIKLCDASNYGIPILTSDIGNEGLGLIHKKTALISNNNNEFVRSLEEFYMMSTKDRKKIGVAGKKHINHMFSKEQASTILNSIFKQKHIVISVLTYNQPDRLRKCIQSIINETAYSNYTIAISNNGKKEPCSSIVEELMKKNPGKIDYYFNNKNLYFIDGNNKIIEHEKYKDSDILLLNDDTEIIDKYWLNYLYSSAYSSNEIGSVGAKTIYPNGMLAEAGAEIYNNGRGLNKGRNNDPNDIRFNKREDTGYCSGCCLYMKRGVINKIGVLSTKLKKLYYEDVEWQYRSHLYGFKTIYEPRSKIVHYEGATNGQNINTGFKKYQEINRKIFLDIMKELGVSDIESFNK